MYKGAASAAVDLEFSLALHEKTGKYYHGRELISAYANLIDRQLFWRVARRSIPQGLVAKIIGRLLVMEVDARVGSSAFDRLAPRQRRRRAVVHMDPFTTLVHRLTASDVVLCHDVGPITHPHLFDQPVVRAYAKAYAEIAEAGPHMVFVSQASRAAFHDIFKGDFASSRVIYPPLRMEVQSGAETPLPGLAAPFLLTVGSIGARKNQARAIEAFAQSGLAAEGVRYVLCGAREPGYETVAERAGSVDGVTICGFVTNEQLNWLYANAAGFVLPSLLEGFGVPVAEAAARGLVPLVSAGSVLEEVAGDGSIPVDPQDTGQIAAGMRSLCAMNEAELRARRAALAQSLARFSHEAFIAGWRSTIEAAIAQ